jgi:hypothetical protein
LSELRSLLLSVYLSEYKSQEYQVYTLLLPIRVWHIFDHSNAKHRDGATDFDDFNIGRRRCHRDLFHSSSMQCSLRKYKEVYTLQAGHCSPYCYGNRDYRAADRGVLGSFFIPYSSRSLGVGTLGVGTLGVGTLGEKRISNTMHFSPEKRSKRWPFCKLPTR